MPPLPAVSIPCSTNRTDRWSPSLLLAYSISCSSAYRLLRSACSETEPSLSPVNPGVPLVSISVTLSPARNLKRLPGWWSQKFGTPVRLLGRQGWLRVRLAAERFERSAGLDNAAQRVPRQHRQVIDQLVGADPRI